jgi:glycosyltransferase involved in cell wall biosynthesis
VPPEPPIAILLCTYQGAPFLSAQLDSFTAQTHARWLVIASDDGSTDETMTVLDACRARWGDDRLIVARGPGRGLTANFLSLACRPDLDAHRVAFSDQDDIWLPDKLARAARCLDRHGDATPALYCSRTRLIDEQGHDIGLSPLFPGPFSFRHALAQNVAGGNTMVLNAAARALLVQAAAAGAEPVLYDWWTYLLVTGCGGRVYYDPEPTVLYRQHRRNQIGANAQVRDRLRNAGEMWRGRVRRWNDANIAALDRVIDRLSPESRVVLETFRHARRQGPMGRVAGLHRSGVRRQTASGTAALFLAAAAGRI